MGVKLRLKEVCDRYGRSKTYWRRMCDDGLIRHFKDGAERIIDSDDIEEYWASRKVEPKVPTGAHPLDIAMATFNEHGD